MIYRVERAKQSHCISVFVIVLALGAGCDPATAEDVAVDGAVTTALEACPMFASDYRACEKTDGALPQFFETVAIETGERGFLFTTPTDQGPLETEYIPDRVVRIGSDFHTLSDGTVLADLPAHESSYCEDGALYRSELTLLPDQTFAQEQLVMQIGDQGQLLFRLDVNGELVLEAMCVE